MATVTTVVTVTAADEDDLNAWIAYLAKNLPKAEQADPQWTKDENTGALKVTYTHEAVIDIRTRA